MSGVNGAPVALPNLDAAVAAEVMGMTVYPAGTLTAYPRRDRHQEAMYYTRQPSHWLAVGTGIFQQVITGETLPVTTALPAYSTDRNACADAEAWMAERGLMRGYTDALFELASHDTSQAMSAGVILAGPEMRCQAMLLAVRAASVTK